MYGILIVNFHEHKGEYLQRGESSSKLSGSAKLLKSSPWGDSSRANFLC